ncbi:Midasin [Wickerhamomyces ciferrii]|uniref:Midasin n=1 Tax=Wickerhamomyces ciferrii (strain ATCC 14091 / BCRC 22168 / CBS 111 / JCM 3599 / NBRC 0793 / NRRL Y-1031 F-60-10) TaxID=1206466 RepID=K0KY13_WICCF|nr:Midasin [Wickerhamomyces ciferrii]CCH46339.1 Midasin [Wickerhamomyces ciferrii]
MLIKSILPIFAILLFVGATPPACFLSCVQVIARWCERAHADFRCVCENSPSLVGCLVDICPYGNFFSARDHFWGTCLERLSADSDNEISSGESTHDARSNADYNKPKKPAIDDIPSYDDESEENETEEDEEYYDDEEEEEDDEETYDDEEDDDYYYDDYDDEEGDDDDDDENVKDGDQDDEDKKYYPIEEDEKEEKDDKEDKDWHLTPGNPFEPRTADSNSATFMAQNIYSEVNYPSEDYKQREPEEEKLQQNNKYNTEDYLGSKADEDLSEKSLDIEKGPSNFEKIRPNHGSLYADYDIESNYNDGKSEYESQSGEEKERYNQHETQPIEEEEYGDYGEGDGNYYNDNDDDNDDDEEEENDDLSENDDEFEEEEEEEEEEGAYDSEEFEEEENKFEEEGYEYPDTSGLYQDYQNQDHQSNHVNDKKSYESNEQDPTSNDFEANSNSEGDNISTDNVDITYLEKENPEVEEDVAKFADVELREKSEALIKQRQKSIDSKFLKGLTDTPINTLKNFNTKQEQHSPYTFTGNRLSHHKPFRSFKEYLEQNEKNVKVVSSSTSHEDGVSDDGSSGDESEIFDQRISKNAPPSRPGRYNNEGTIEEDIVKGIPKKIKSQVLRLPHNAKAVASKIKNKII